MRAKKILFLCFLFNYLSFSVLKADVDVDFHDIGSEQISKPAQQKSPFSFGSYCDFIGSSKIKNHYFHKGEEVHFAEAQMELDCAFYYDPAYTEGARVGLGYTATSLRWSNNPRFNQDHFYTASLVFSGFTQRLDKWFWRTQLSINFDAKYWAADYTSYDLLLWGRYTYSDTIGVHIGFFGQTGIRLDRIYPVIGFDWQISNRWKLNVVYPMNISLEYKISQNWSVAIAERNFDFRHRVRRHDSNGRSLVRYQNIGIEFAVKYEGFGMSFNIHAGSTVGGRYRIADKHNHNALTYKLKGAAYAGAEMDISF